MGLVSHSLNASGLCLGQSFPGMVGPLGVPPSLAYSVLETCILCSGRSLFMLENKVCPDPLTVLIFILELLRNAELTYSGATLHPLSSLFTHHN